jgi:hypothetical protein
MPRTLRQVGPGWSIDGRDGGSRSDGGDFFSHEMMGRYLALAR